MADRNALPVTVAILRRTIDRAFYDGPGIGLFCARGPETTDLAFCERVYAMPDAIRPLPPRCG